jgi:Holliday junction resolvase RusA-like endonuclease
VIELPFPPSILNPNRKAHWAVKSKAFKKYKNECAWIAKQMQPCTEFYLIIHPPDNRRRDRDNIIGALKAAQDGLALAWGIDDSKFTIMYSTLQEPVKGGKIIIKKI